ncbi:hypothetical protein GpartN1_g1725.t1 [Galdieria partita]|uniref:Uncharacterized protein n=1 Tax=Galdieria partita TaxID=83374 RepID=A0A9C7PTD0_9RHOD|nr:hypothetical protein GpartN1_g1725.t1 [Galdieria partita]
MPKPNASFQTEQSSSKGKYTSFNLNALLPKQKSHSEASVKGVGNSRMQVLGKSSVLSRAAPKVPLPFNLPSLRKESAVEATSDAEYKDGKDSSPQRVETSRQEQPNSYATVAASRMKSHTVKYSPTMSGKNLLETDEHSRDIQDNNPILNSAQGDPQRNDMYADAQQKNFPTLSHSSKFPARVFVSRNDMVEEALEVPLTQENLDDFKSEKFQQNEQHDVRTDNRGNERISYSSEKESFSEPEKEPENLLKDKKRVILRRQEETQMSTGREEQSWNTERVGDFTVEYGVSSTESESLCESDTVAHGKPEITGTSLNSGFLSDSNVTSAREVQGNDSITNDRATHFSKQEYLRGRASETSKVRHSSSRARMSSRYIRHVSTSKVKSSRRGMLSENLSSKTWRVVSDQRRQKFESRNKESVGNDSLPKKERFHAEGTQVLKDTLPRWSVKSSNFEDKGISQSKEASSSSKDRNLSEMNNIEELLQSISLEETSVLSQKQGTDVDFVPFSVKDCQREYPSNEGSRKTESEVNGSSFLTFGSLLSDLNTLNDSSDWSSPVLDSQSSVDKVLSGELWDQVNNAMTAIQSDTYCGMDKASNTPIAKQKFYPKLSRKRSIQNGRIHRKKALAENNVPNRTKKNAKVWMAKESASSFLDKQQKTDQNVVKPKLLDVGEIDRPSFTNIVSSSQTLPSFTNKANIDRASRKWRKIDSPVLYPRSTRNSRTYKEWVAKHPKISDNRYVINDTNISLHSQDPEKNTSISVMPNHEWCSNSGVQKSLTNSRGKIKSQKVSTRGRNSTRWRKVTEREVSKDTINMNGQEMHRSSLDGYRPHSSKTSRRGRSRSVQYVPKNV